MTNLSDVVFDENDEEVKNLLISIQSDSLSEQQQSNKRLFFFLRISSIIFFFLLAIRSFLSLKRTSRSSKTSILNDRNNEFIFDEEHLLELLKRLKQQSEQNPSLLTLEDESNLFDVLISKYP